MRWIRGNWARAVEQLGVISSQPRLRRCSRSWHPCRHDIWTGCLQDVLLHRGTDDGVGEGAIPLSIKLMAAFIVANVVTLIATVITLMAIGALISLP